MASGSRIITLFLPLVSCLFSHNLFVWSLSKMVSRIKLLHQAEFFFTLKDEEVTSELESYFLMYWSGKYIISEMKDGVITKDGVRYHVSFAHNCTRGKILANKSNQYRLSFRRFKKEHNIPNFVVISFSH